MSAPSLRSPGEKRILVHGGSKARFESLVAAMARGAGGELTRHLGQPVVRLDAENVRFIAAYDVDGVREVLSDRYVNLLVVDLCDLRDAHERCRAARAVLRAIDATEDRELRYGFHRILVVLPDDADPAYDDLLIELGRMGLRHVLRVEHRDDSVSDDVGARVFTRLCSMIDASEPGKTALVSNGGGITGIHFEIGALKCLDDCLSPGGVNEFDAFYGISAGAVVNSLLAVGYTVDEMMAAVAGVPGGRIPNLDLNLLRISHVNFAENAWRWRRAVTTALRASMRVLRGFDRRAARDAADEIFLEWTSLIGAPFHSHEFERMLADLLETRGGTNRFSDLPRPLYIGATDQDARRAVLFGDEGFSRVPISRAVQASLSINPAFGGVRIDDRFYEDGAITRTSNYVEAIRHGARLVFVLDPFVPYVSKQAGANNKRGMLYNLDQDVRTLSFTRFESVRDLTLREHPEVSSYTFLPANSQRKLLSVNPMDHRPFLAIWRAAYLSTLQRLEAVEHRLAGDLAVRGRKLDLSRAKAVAERLRRRGAIDFGDFYPDRRVSIRKFLLVRERGIARAEPRPLAAE